MFHYKKKEKDLGMQYIHLPSNSATRVSYNQNKAYILHFKKTVNKHEHVMTKSTWKHNKLINYIDV